MRSPWLALLFVLALASACEAKSARREILSAPHSAPRGVQVVSAERIREKSPLNCDATSGGLDDTIHPDATPSDDSDNKRTSNRYDAAGQLIETVNEDGGVTQYGYDAAGRQTTVTAPNGKTTTTEYDNTGRKTATVDPRGQRTTYRYDAAGRLTETVLDNGKSGRMEFDAVGRKTAAVNPAGERSEYRYDLLGRLTEVRQFLDGRTLTTRYRYDEQGNKLEQIDALGRSTTWTFDAMGRELSRTLPGGETERSEYDVAGRKIAHLDFKHQRTTFAYDAADRLTTTTYADGRIETQRYDAAGNRTQLISPEGTTTWVYDARNRVTQETQPNSAVIDYRFDGRGNRTTTTHTQGAATSEARYTFDPLSRLESAQEGTTPVTVSSYDDAGNLTQEMQGDTLTQYRYDRLNRLIEIHSTTAGATKQRHVYTLDDAGRRTKIEEAGPSGTQVTDYTYDGLGRLTSETETVGATIAYRASYGYDDVGNRTSVTENGVTTTATFDANDRLLTQGSDTFEYDANGNQTKKIAASGTTTYTYDVRNKLIDASDSATGARLQFSYDADGNRLTRRAKANAAAPDVETRFVIDRSFGLPEVIAELDATGAITARYLHGYQLIQQTTQAGANAVLRYPLRDALGSTRYLVDGAGAVTDGFRTNAWGEPRERTGTTATMHRFAGEAWEDALGLGFNRARWYSPSQARFTQQDTWDGNQRRPVTLAKYAYADLNPISFSDPTGRSAILLENNLALGIMVRTFATSVRYTVYVGTAILAGYELSNLMSDVRVELEEDVTILSQNALTAEQEREKQAEYDVMYRLTRMPPEPGNGCDNLSRNIHHAQAVIARYEAWDAKWFPGRHAQKILDWKKRLENLKKQHKDKCT